MVVQNNIIKQYLPYAGDTAKFSKPENQSCTCI